MNELKFALRQLAKSPGFTLAAVLVLALGIGASTAIFSVVEAALLRPLPFPEPDRLVRAYEALDELHVRDNTSELSELTLQQWEQHGGDIFQGLAASSPASLTLADRAGGAARYVAAARITANFFSVLEINPALGRSFTRAEDTPNGPRVVLLSHDFWQREFGGSPGAIGQVLRLDGQPHTVVGIMPVKFRHPYRADLWVPLAPTFEAGPTRYRYLDGVARLQPGVTIDAADAALRRICAGVNADRPDPQNARRAYLTPLHEGFISNLRPKLLAIYGAALCALLVAAANFAGLLLARAVERERETAVRAALGASPRQLLREALGFSLLLATLGTALGLLLANWLTPLLVALSPEGTDATGSALRDFDHAVRLDPAVFGFAAFLLLLTGLGAGLLPAWRATRADLRSPLGGGSRSASLDRGTRRSLQLLVIGEIALALVLLVGAGLLAQHFHALTRQPWGFATKNRLGFKISLDRAYPTAELRVRALDQVLAELRTLPGVQAAGVTMPHPLDSAREIIGTNAESVTPPEPRGFRFSYLRASGPGYFTAAGQAMVSGRDFTENDNASGPRVCLVDETYARRAWPGEDPIGKRVKWGRLDNARRPWFIVVGIVAETRVVLDPKHPDVTGTVCFPIRQLLAELLAFSEYTIVLETAGETRALESAVRAAVGRIDRGLAVYEWVSLEEVAAQTRATERFAFLLVSLFGLLGVILSAIGLYGLLALQVARRTRELGIRVALGATAGGIIRTVATDGMILLAGGVVAGGAIAWLAVLVARRQWPELPPASGLIFIGAGLVLGAAMTLACWLPVRRAIKADPLLALKSD